MANPPGEPRNGETPTQLMIDHNVGVSTIPTYELKKIDSDYFMEE